MRHKSRSCLYPEVPRTFHNGVKGTFMDDQTHNRYFAKIDYNKDPQVTWKDRPSLVRQRRGCRGAHLGWMREGGLRDLGPTPVCLCVDDLSRARCSVSAKIDPRLLNLLLQLPSTPLLPYNYKARSLYGTGCSGVSYSHQLVRGVT